jgi:hypothetical protein
VPHSRRSVPELIRGLSWHIGRCGLKPGELRAIGWFDFRSVDREEEGDAVTVASEALLYLAFDDSGAWNRKVPVVFAVTAFLRDETGYQLTAAEAQTLRGLLERGASASDKIRDWFDHVYPCG